MDRVFIVTYDWMEEGPEIMGVFRTHIGAQNCIDNLMRNHSDTYDRLNFMIHGEYVE